jgi:hypothetical protein
VESVHRRDDGEARAPLFGDQLRQRRGQSALARTGRAGDAEQKALGRRICGGEDVVRQASYSLLEAAQRLIPLSVA